MLRTLTRISSSSSSSSSTLSTSTKSFLILRKMSSSASAASSASNHPLPTLPGPVVSVDWLQSHYPRLKVVDASWYMPNEKQDPQVNFERGRLPNSIFFDLEGCTNKDGPNANLPHMLPTKEQFSKYMNQLGLTREDVIVLYDGKGIFSAPRIRLTMKLFGVENVAILDGGIKEWIAAGHKIESGPPSAPTIEHGDSSSSEFVSSPIPAGFVRSMSQVRTNSLASEPTFQLIDARPQGRFDGTDPEPRPDIPSGHIAGALSVPFGTLLETRPSGGTAFKKAEELRRIFKEKGVDIHAKQPLVGTCGSGVTACVVLLGLELAGRKTNVGIYDGSWTEWALNKENKIEKK